ncbi:SDR family NAD(P)-dependent oxidoreductase [Bacteroidales bacterium OttesenSCG-928-C03]|nr:SDR family NAD(P)-dependent oxidoreductase [Bacteroidales bacterium OttesenSCG-928-C03]MDL2326614.1 SDR family NAD(P)-dependent oxidoreductase [Bacteroidales bacterium OttesenSCG-928-A14]
MKKTILITGANSGFGKAIALNLSKYDCRLILTGRSMEKLQPVIDEIKKMSSANVYPLVFDVRDFEAVKAAVASLPSEFQQIDVLVNNAGLAQELNTIDQGDIEDWNRMIDANIKGILHVTKVVSPQMIARKEGHIINIGSIASHEIYKGGSVYCASKHAVLALSKGMRTDFLEHNIRVTQVSPGAAETNFSLTRFHGDEARAAKVYEGYEPLSAEDVADVVEFAITRPAHVCLNEIIMTPTAQFNGTIVRN